MKKVTPLPTPHYHFRHMQQAHADYFANPTPENEEKARKAALAYVEAVDDAAERLRRVG